MYMFSTSYEKVAPLPRLCHFCNRPERMPRTTSFKIENVDTRKEFNGQIREHYHAAGCNAKAQPLADTKSKKAVMQLSRKIINSE